MSRLLIFHPALAPYRLDFFNALGKMFDCKVVFLQRQNDELLIQQQELLKNATFRYEYLDQHFKLFGRDINLGYWQTIRAFKPDVVLCCEYTLSLWATLAYRTLHRSKFRLYTMTDDSQDMAEARQGGKRRRQMYLLRHIDGLVTISPEMADWYKHNSPTRRLFSFPIIRDEERFRAEQSLIAPFAATHVSRWQLEGKKVCLFVGRFVALKNLRALIEAFAAVVRKEEEKDSLRLVLVGQGEERDNLLKTAEENGMADKVLFPGAYGGHELMAWYRTASVFVLGSWQEAFGAVTNEALLSGCRVMVSRYAGSRSLVTPENGRVFDSLNADDFQQTLASLLATAMPTPANGFERPSLMPVSFQERIRALSEFLQ